ncbi:hypothetical protein [Deinococcus aestuarii]|uniref:hypothetical protein n=1 Tax=Deinococcus aestuarii TaxID=2774531 RepID=UPI001C0CCF11|nr:hypothetical protein [Deinococcus aestuarii]
MLIVENKWDGSVTKRKSPHRGGQGTSLTLLLFQSADPPAGSEHQHTSSSFPRCTLLLKFDAGRYGRYGWSMRENAAFAHAVNQALLTVASTAGLSWTVKGRVFKRLERRVRAAAYANSDWDDFAEWCQLELADLLANEDIGSLCRLSLAAWFAREVLSCLTGSFDGDEAA